MKSRSLIVLIVALLAIGVLASCGVPRSSSNSESSASPTAELTVKPTARPTVASGSSSDSVTLKAALGNSTVQMFGTSPATREQVVATFPTGTSCTRVSGPTPVIIEGISMTFYRLNCNGQVGDVNAKWVIK